MCVLLNKRLPALQYQVVHQIRMSVSSSAAFAQVPLSQTVLFGSAILFQCVAAPMLNVTRLIWYVDGDSSEAVGATDMTLLGVGATSTLSLPTMLIELNGSLISCEITTNETFRTDNAQLVIEG